MLARLVTKMFDQSYKTVATTSNINLKKVPRHLVDQHFIEKQLIDRHFIDKHFIDRHFSFRLPIIYWNITFFEFSMIIDGNTEKVLQFIMPA